MGQLCSHEEACCRLESDLGIKKPFAVEDATQSESALPRVGCLLSEKWLAAQIKAKVICPQDNTYGSSILPEEQISLLQPSPQCSLNGWQRVVVTVIKKPLKKIRIRKYKHQNVEEYTFYDVLHSLSTEDNATLKDYICRQFASASTKESCDDDFLDEEKLSSLIQETFGIRLKYISNDTLQAKPSSESDDVQCPEDAKNVEWKQLHHIVPLLLACQNSTHVFLLESAPSYTLFDVLAFSPAIISNSSAKHLSLLYQILKIVATLQGKGFNISPSLSFKDIYVTDSLWLSISAFQIDDYDVVQKEEPGQTALENHWPVDTPFVLTPPFPLSNSLHEYTARWINWELTTFDYLLILNTLAGRRMKDPAHHPIFPWVIDFTRRDGGFRDLKKSKYRLCKSDAQLDITYYQPVLEDSRTGMITHTPHHISDDPLTAISYYVYCARRVSKDVLCRTVRPRWIPEEYPSSIERLYSWTPEECIPEFYSDPLIFKSVHADLPDLALPPWTQTAEDFIKHHRDALEGDQVSRYLHNWIDLVFGFQLSGRGSVDAKNVYLSLVDKHSHLTNFGVLQLFSRPHPARKIRNLVDEHFVEVVETYSDTLESYDTSVFTENEASEPLMDDGVSYVVAKPSEVDPADAPILRRDAFSIESAIDEVSQVEEPRKSDEADSESRLKSSSQLLPGLKLRIDKLFEGGGAESRITPSSDFKITIDGCSNFIKQLKAVEKELEFQHQISPIDADGIGEYKFGSIFDKRKPNGQTAGYQEYEAAGMTERKDILVLANLLIELVLHDFVRLRGRRLTFEERLFENVRLMKANPHKFTSLLVTILESWLRPLEMPLAESEKVVASFFKTPNLLQNQFINPFPFPKYFPVLHNLISILYSNDLHVDDAVAIDMKSSPILPVATTFPSVNNIIQTSHLVRLLTEELDDEGVDLLATFVAPLFSNQSTRLHAFLHIFPQLGNVMGHRRSIKSFFHGLQRLFDGGTEERISSGKLLDQSFIWNVIRIFGLSCFLEHFLPFVVDGLIEATNAGNSKENNEVDDQELECPSYDTGKDEGETEEKVATILDSDSEGMQESLFSEKREKDGAIEHKPWILDRENNDFDSNTLQEGKSKPQALSTFGHMSSEDTGSSNEKTLSRSEILRKSSNMATDNFSLKRTGSDANFSISDKSGVIFSANGDSVFENRRHYSSSERMSSNEEKTDSSSNLVSNGDGRESSCENRFTENLADSDEDALTSSTDEESLGNILKPLAHASKGSYDVASSEAVKRGRPMAPEKIVDTKLASDVDKKVEVGSGDKSPSHFDIFVKKNSSQVNSCNAKNSFALKKTGSDVFLSISDKSEVIFNANGDSSTQIEETNTRGSESSYDVVSNEAAKRRRSTLSENVRNMTLSVKTEQVVHPLQAATQDESLDQSSVEEEPVAGIEDFSIDSMYSEDEGKSFLIRRSSLKMKDRSDTSPFMVLPSNDDAVVNRPTERSKSESFEEYTEIPAQSIADADELEDISKIAGIGNAEAPIMLRAEELALATLKWICPWLGPELTSKHVINPILKKISKIWVSMKKVEYTTEDLKAAVNNKMKFLVDCLVDVARIYGDAIVLQQYLPYSTRAVGLALKAKSVSANVEGQLFSALEILSRTLVTLQPETLADGMEALSQDMFEPLLRLLSSLKPFSSGFQVRSLLLHSVVSLMAALCQTLGQLDARGVMTPLLQRFFSSFDCVYRIDEKSGVNAVVVRKYSFLDESDKVKADFAGMKYSGDPSTKGFLGDRSVHEERDADSSQQTKKSPTEDKDDWSQYKNLLSSFTPALAHYSYVLFCRVLGNNFVSSILYNEKLIWQLCSNFDENLTSRSKELQVGYLESHEAKAANTLKQSESDKGKLRQTCVEFSDALLLEKDHTNKRFPRKRTVSDQEDEEPVYRSSWQYMGGEWLNEWKERLDARYDDRHLKFKSRKLQTYAGHSSAVRDIYVPDNEQYFLSASRDKSVKFWLLKNHGNGTSQLACTKTYDKHTKSVFAVQSIQSKMLNASCDGTVHVWDPVRFATLDVYDLGKNSSVTCIKTLPPPYAAIAVATNEGTMRLYDVREKAVSAEWKLVSTSVAGVVKCLGVNEAGTWIAAGFSSGFLSVLDLRTGSLRTQCRAHESEVLQIEPYNDHSFLSISNDFMMKMWHDNRSIDLRFKRPPEPINCVTFCDKQCVWSTTSGNRIGITHKIENGASYESAKLPQELFRGAISKLRVVPVKQLYLVGSENGNIVMFA